MRTGTEQFDTTEREPVRDSDHSFATNRRPTYGTSVKTPSDFTQSQGEETAMTDLQEELNAYIVQKHIIREQNPDNVFLNVQDYLNLTRATHTQKSYVEFRQVIDAVADSKDTMMSLIDDFHKEFIVENKKEFLIVEGDAKIFDVLKSLKSEYGDDLSWLIPYPGDWHMLMNYLYPLMKAYFDAGLKSLAQAAGYPIAQIQHCAQFKRTHHFLLEVWEAAYCTMLSSFQSTLNEEQLSNTRDLLETSIFKSLLAVGRKCENDQQLEYTLIHHFAQFETKIAQNYQQFRRFLQKMAQSDYTWRFWIQFVFEDAMAYIGLFLAIRSGNWNLRMASMKKMASIFTAFDHQTYQRIISRHIADLLEMPTTILAMYQQGAFVVSINGRPWHSVAIDESHEMLINRSVKSAVVRPTKDHINRVAQFITYSTTVLDNFRKQLYPEKQKEQHRKSLLSTQSTDRAFNNNVKAQMRQMKDKALFEVTSINRGLINPMTGVHASSEQEHDLLNFRYIGQREYLSRIASVILQQPSATVPNRKRRLVTFSDNKKKGQRISQLERDRRLILLAMRKKINHSKKQGNQYNKPVNRL